MATLVKVRKSGKSIFVVIPRKFARSRRIDVGTILDIDAVCVARQRRRYKLSELLAKFKPEHRQGEWRIDAPVGREVW